MLRLPSAAAFFELPRWERAEWFVWWRLRNCPPEAETTTKAARAGSRPRRGDASPDTTELAPGIHATAEGRSFWMGG
jgi:hypothetical protein